MSTGAAPKPKIGNITKFFIPGLAIGLAIGAVGGAYYAPAVEQSLTMPEGMNKPVVRNKPAPESPAPTAATGQTGATGTSGASGEPPAPAPK